MASQVARNVRRVGKGYITRPRVKTPADYGGLIKDPAIERWMTMRETTTPHFKWTPKSFGLIAFWCGVVPYAMMHYVHQEVKDRLEAEGKEARFFPFSDEMPSRRPDPLPPRKAGVQIDHF
eukprot:TCONS_00008186-protein